MNKLDYRCPGNYCLQATRCRRYMPEAKNCQLPFAAFDMRDTVECDGFLPRIMDPIRVESEGAVGLSRQQDDVLIRFAVRRLEIEK